MSRLLRIARSHGITGQLVRYGVVAASGYLLAIVLYTLEVDAGIAPYLALGIAFVLNGLYNFALVRIWAFPPSGRGVRSDFGRFCIAAGVSFVVNYAAFAVLYSSIGLDAKIAQRLAVLIAAPVTFLINRHWSFRARASADGQPSAAAQQSARSPTAIAPHTPERSRR